MPKILQRFLQPKRRRRAHDERRLGTACSEREEPARSLEQSLDLLCHAQVDQATRSAAAASLQRAVGNAEVTRMLAQRNGVATADTGVVQPQRTRRRGGGANPGGRGPGRLRHATEQPYTVSGPTLDDLVGQLDRFGGFGAETNAPLGMNGRVRPQRLPDGTFRARVQWTISGTTSQLPRWDGYAAACAVAQQEWDRFMQRTRQHEQAAHIDAARDFVAQLGEDDTVIIGATVAEVQSNLETKQQDLAARLQALHDGCDHGVAIDAVLHPDNGQC